MTEKKRFSPSKRRIWLGAAASLFLAAIGCLILRRGSIVGWFLIAFASLGILAPWLLLRKKSAWLELDAEGFTLCVSVKPDRFLWSHIANLTVWNGVVSFDLHPEFRGGRRGQGTARMLSGHDGSIPDMFDVRPCSLADIMNKYKQIGIGLPITEEPSLTTVRTDRVYGGSAVTDGVSSHRPIP